MIEPRLAATDQISLTNQLNTAKAELRASESARETARLGLERARILNADRKNVSDRVLQEAESRWNAEEARWSTAQDAVRLLEASLRSMGPGGRSALVTRRGGEVVEVMAQPGEAIESGQPVVRLARFDQLLARVALPVAQNAPAEATRALISVMGLEGQPVTGDRVALASSVDPRVQSPSLVFRLNQPPPGSRPGLAVTAWVRLPGAARRGYLVPRAAVVHFRGKKYVYVEKEPGLFERREIEAPEPVDGGYFTTNLRGEDRVVINGAQALLSEENKTGLEVEGE
ncbi:MAG TPA: HlyD family efflux transporter periplasmic adaptor subunit [Bryobacteraceae bacterium]|nr:HlyD family efflux transporter periplasmic adaptor subunit [Bryobacteraceae bacterium]